LAKIAYFSARLYSFISTKKNQKFVAETVWC